MKKNSWIWIVLVFFSLSGSLYLFSSSGMSNHTLDFAKASLDKDLYQNALIKAGRDEKVRMIFGELQPINKLAILEGEVRYSDDNKTVKISLGVIGSKEKGTMHLLAHIEGEKWKYEKIDIIAKEKNIKVIIVGRE